MPLRLSRVQEDTITEVLSAPGINILDLLHRVKRHQHTYADARGAILSLISERVIVEGYPNGGVYFNRNQGKVYRGPV